MLAAFFNFVSPAALTRVLRGYHALCRLLTIGLQTRTGLGRERMQALLSSFARNGIRPELLPWIFAITMSMVVLCAIFRFSV